MGQPKNANQLKKQIRERGLEPPTPCSQGSF